MAVLNGTDAFVNAAFQVWALDTTVADEHVEQMAGWADLQHLMLSGTLVTDRCLPAISTFHRLVCLDLGGTAITASGIATANIPPAVRDFGLYDIQLDDIAFRAVASLPNLRALNCNGCGLSHQSLLRFLRIPSLQGIEALGTDMPDSDAEEFTRTRPNFLLRLDSGVWKGGDVHRPPGYQA
ncbi:Leucine Rich repeats (2 copies) [Planctomycetes bacterium K23_9]|uniref:Leucine Rich repeats (2 copies) n=2 Tax=Stieleria marina TaxID=1930275 RepID=A0A517NTR3_9BACT|nr:Leucine Rich repeats (2 copies) [Planctomycetes bacterium K23_9]